MANSSAFSDAENPEGSTAKATALAEELAEICQREATSRLKAAREYVRLRAELDKLRKDLDQKDRDREALVVHLESFTRMLAKAEDERATLAEKNARMRTSLSWKVTQPFRALAQTLRPRVAKNRTCPAHASLDVGFVYYFYTTPFQLHREGTVRLRGWAFTRDGRRIAGLRAFVDERVFVGKYGLEEAEVLRVHGPLSPNAQPGFEVEIEIPAGRHKLKMEALLEGRDWASFFQAPIWGS